VGQTGKMNRLAALFGAKLVRHTASATTDVGVSVACNVAYCNTVCCYCYYCYLHQVILCNNMLEYSRPVIYIKIIRLLAFVYLSAHCLLL
jgi:hypothetical protein